MPESIDPVLYRDLVRRALAEDLGTGDITTAAIVPATRLADGVFVAKSPLTLAGIEIARAVCVEVDAGIQFEPRHRDGDTVAPGVELAIVHGRAVSLLAAERTALNLLQYLSGIATLTRAFVEAARPLRVLDTRKTAPGLRRLAKYAVTCGGGENHRIGLFDGILVKDNHIRVAGSIAEAVRRVRQVAGKRPVEVETQSLEQVDDALAAGADIIMLDNLDDRTTREAIARIAGRARIELSGNMSLARVRALADAGADVVSVGALTHSAPAADISLEITIAADDVRIPS